MSFEINTQRPWGTLSNEEDHLSRKIEGGAIVTGGFSDAQGEKSFRWCA
jgi:hypothetical protein